MGMELGPCLRKAFCGDAVTAVLGTILLGLAALYMAVGAIHMGECPVETRIPDFMIVMGVAYALLGILRFGQIVYRGVRSVPITDDEEEEGAGQWEEPKLTTPSQTKTTPRGRDNPAAVTIIEEEEDDDGNSSSNSSSNSNEGKDETETNTPPASEKRKHSGVTFDLPDLPAKPRRVLFQEPEPEVESEPEVVEEDEGEYDEDDDEDELVGLPEEVPIKMNLITLIECIILIFLGVWFVAGGLWVFRTEDEVQFDDPLMSSYCAPLLYKTAVASLILALTLLVIGLVFLVVAICGNCCCSEGETEDEEDDLDYLASVEARRSMALYLGDRRASAMFQHDRKKSIQWDRRRASMYDRRGSIYTYDARRGSRRYDRRPTAYVPSDRRESTMSDASYGSGDRRQSTVLSPTDRRQSTVSPKTDRRQSTVSPKTDRRQSTVSPKTDRRQSTVSPKTDRRQSTVSTKQNNRRDSEVIPSVPGNYRRTSTDFYNDINAQYI